MTATGKTGHSSVKPKKTRSPFLRLNHADNQSQKSLRMYVGLGYSPLGFLGVHKFYLGKTAEGLAFLLPSLLLLPLSLWVSFFLMSGICWILLKMEVNKSWKNKTSIRDAEGRALQL